MTAEELRALAPPDGWEWVRRPTLRTAGEIRCTSVHREDHPSKASAALRLLHRWAEEHEFGISNPSEGVRWYHPNLGIVGHWYSRWSVKANAPERTLVRTRTYNRKCCGRATQAHQLVCEQCYVVLTCRDCGFGGFTLYPVDLGQGESRALCANCSKPCETKGCKQRIRKDGNNAKKCMECEPQFYCDWCDRITSDTDEHRHIIEPERRRADGRILAYARKMCNACYDKRACPKCKTFNVYMELVTRSGEKMCRMCADAEDAAKLEKDTEFAPDEIPISGSLVIPSTKSRPFRTVSIETEMDGDGGFIARQLYRKGFVDRPEVAGYGEHAPKDDRHVAFLKYDGSVTGGELITGRVNLDDPDQASAVLSMLGTVRALEKANKAAFDKTCGGHIHIDAHNLDISDAWRYITVYNYLENVIYRLAGAGTGKLKLHRTLVPGHDAPNGGRGYSHGVIKGPFGTQSAFGRNLQQMDRMCGLNFKSYFEARMNCQCGAFAAEDSKKCKCNLGKNTIEWRVWNSTANPRILHAWIALMQALTAFAESETRMSDAEELKYPAFAWDRKQYRPEIHESLTKERLEWIHTTLPLTQAERDSLIFTAKNSELSALGSEYLESLALLENNAAVPEKKGVRNPARRERKILIQPPAPGDPVPFGKRATARLRMR